MSGVLICFCLQVLIYSFASSFFPPPCIPLPLIALSVVPSFTPYGLSMSTEERLLLWSPWSPPPFLPIWDARTIVYPVSWVKIQEVIFDFHNSHIPPISVSKGWFPPNIAWIWPLLTTSPTTVFLATSMCSLDDCQGLLTGLASSTFAS